jgi:hypothetical protein
LPKTCKVGKVGGDSVRLPRRLAGTPRYMISISSLTHRLPLGLRPGRSACPMLLRLTEFPAAMSEYWLLTIQVEDQ